MKQANLFLVSDSTNKAQYFREIITYSGLLHSKIELSDIETIENSACIIIFYGRFDYDKKLAKNIKKLAKKGHSIIIVNPSGGSKRLERYAGIKIRDPGDFPFSIGGTQNNSLGEGFLRISDKGLTDHFMDKLAENPFPLHGFGSTAIKSADSKIIATYTPTTNSSSYPCITSRDIGNGRIIIFGPDIVYTTRKIQEGNYVFQDGVTPADGMAPIDDGILKCEDGLVLDWNADRRPVSPSYKVPAFIVPIVDVWRELLVQIIILAGHKSKVPIKRVMYWPEGSEFAALISHDTDGNDEELARILLQRINDYGIKTTWCLIPPGYSPDLCKEIKTHGHELAFHFDAQSYKLLDIFSFESLEGQFQDTLENTRIKSFYSNKNHYTRWERRTEFFQWLSKLGMKIDQSKGPSKCGTIGFRVGSAHPWIPTDNYGNLIDCLELSFQSQDLGMQGPDDIGPEIVDAVRSVNGVVHFIFHPAHSKKKDVQKRLDELVDYIKKNGGKFMRSIDIGKWFYERRKLIQNQNLDEINKHSLMVLQRANYEDKDWEKI